MIRSALSPALLAVATLAACGPAPDASPGPALVAVAGETGTAPAPDSLYARYGVEGRLIGLDAAALGAFEAHAMSADFPAGAPARRFEGPRLSALLAAAGAPGAGARLTALDGYRIDVEAERIAAFEPILAIRADGEPLAVGGLGPAILVWPRLDDERLEAMTDDAWIWGVFAIEPAPEDG